MEDERAKPAVVRKYAVGKGALGVWFPSCNSEDCIFPLGMLPFCKNSVSL